MVKKTTQIHYYEAVGRRKVAIARTRLYIVGKDGHASIESNKYKAGTILVNKKDIKLVFPSLLDKVRYLAPLKLTNNEERFVISILVKGGGLQGQLEAIILGLSRAIEKVDKAEYRPLLKKEGFLRRDPRARERRKVGTGGKARRAKQSPKR